MAVVAVVVLTVQLGEINAEGDLRLAPPTSHHAAPPQPRCG